MPLILFAPLPSSTPPASLRDTPQPTLAFSLAHRKRLQVESISHRTAEVLVRPVEQAQTRAGRERMEGKKGEGGEARNESTREGREEGGYNHQSAHVCSRNWGWD
eukprot:798254-Rhodomonas_salina.2